MRINSTTELANIIQEKSEKQVFFVVTISGFGGSPGRQVRP